MALWFDKNNQIYASDGKGRWLKYYIDKVAALWEDALQTETAQRKAGDEAEKTAREQAVSAESAARAAHEANRQNPHQVTKAQLGLGNVDNTSDMQKPISTAVQAALNQKADAANATGGFAAGTGASAVSSSGAAIGKGATSHDTGCAVGDNAWADTGAAIGKSAFCAGNGGAVGVSASAIHGFAGGGNAKVVWSGGAVGSGAYAGNGFSGGLQAKVADTEDGPVDAIQLGTGTNSDAKSLQVYSYTLMDGQGQIPAARLAGATNSVSGENAATLGGFSNSVGGSASIVLGGHHNVSAYTNSFIGGGNRNKTLGAVTAIVGGEENTANGTHAFIGGGNNCIAGANNAVFGHYNKYTDSDAGTASGTAGTAMMIGNGTESAAANAFRVSYAGEVYGTGAFHTSGADLAHVFEWSDGNPQQADRRGYFVALTGGKVKLAEPDDKRIIGVVSDNASFVANDYTEHWQGMYLRDIYGGYVTETVTETVTDPETGAETTKEVVRRKLNPDYDAALPYTPRSARPEYAVVGHNGILVVNDDGTCAADGYCAVAAGGTATKSTAQTPYYVLKRLDDSHIQIFI